MRTSISFASLIFFILFGIGAAAGFAVYKTTGNQIVAEGVGGIGFVVALIVSLSIKVADQWERVVIVRLGEFHSLKGQITPIHKSMGRHPTANPKGRNC